MTPASGIRKNAATTRRAQRELARQLARDFGVSFDLAFKAVKAGVHARCAELAAQLGDCRTRGFIAAVQTLADTRRVSADSRARERVLPDNWGKTGSKPVGGPL